MPRYSPNLRSFDVTSLRRDHLAARLPTLYSSGYCSTLEITYNVQNLSHRLANNIKNAPDGKISLLACGHYRISVLRPSFDRHVLRFSFGSETTSVWQLHEIRERISLDAHCPVMPLEPKPATMGSDLGSIVL